MLKAVIIFALFVFAVSMYSPTGVNVVGFKDRMLSRNAAASMTSLLTAEQSFVQMTNTLPSLTNWEADIRSTRSNIPDFRPYSLTYDEASGTGRYFCLSATSPQTGDVEQFLDLQDRLLHLQPVLSTDCGDTTDAPGTTNWTAEDDINITVFTGN